MPLVTQEDLKHELPLNEDARIVRYYRRVYGKGATLDFCHLFWGTVGYLPLTVITVVCSPLILILFVIWKLARKFKQEQKPTNLKRTIRHGLQRFLEQVCIRGARVVYRLSAPAIQAVYRVTLKPVVWVMRKVWRSLSWPRRILISAGGLTVVICVTVLLGSGLTEVPGEIYLKIAVTTGEVAGFIAAACVAISAFVFLLTLGREKDYHIMLAHKLDSIADVVVTVLTIPARPVWYLAARPLLLTSKWAVVAPTQTSWEIFKFAYRAVKTNTCPKIVLVSSEGKLVEEEPRQIAEQRAAA